MKKIVILVITLLLLSGCEKMQIANTVYVSSIGIDYKDNKYEGYFYIPPTRNIAKNDSSDSAPTIGKVEADDISMLFSQLANSVTSNVNFNHLKTVIFSEEFLSRDVNIALFLDYIKSTFSVSYNFYVFATVNSFEDIYSYTNPTEISDLYSIINTPSMLDYKYYGISSVHFLSFANDYDNVNRVVCLPILSKTEVYNSDDKKFTTLIIDGYINLFSKNVFNEESIRYLTSGNKDITIDDVLSKLINYSVSYEVIDNKYTFVISYHKLVNNNTDVSGFLNNLIKKYLDDLILKDGRIFYIDRYNYQYNNSLPNDKYDILIHEKKTSL